MRFLKLVFLLTLLPLRAEDGLYQRPVIIGASLSDGFYLPELGIPFVSPESKALGMHHYLERERPTKGERIVNWGSNWMFVAPGPKGAFQVKKAREAKPSVVFAVDYLFWYLYGNARSRSEADRGLTRLEFFDKGLAELATLECPVVVGNIPDAGEAVGVILAPAQYPGVAEIQAANLRLEEWLKEHPKMVLVDLAGFHRLATNNEEVKVGDEVVPAGRSRAALIQRDLLHPTRQGIDAIVKVAVAALAESRK
ncbi:hypothetical protein V2O64_21095 [Verrucomicrobiaceae bacterium 227]